MFIINFTILQISLSMFNWPRSIITTQSDLIFKYWEFLHGLGHSFLISEILHLNSRDYSNFSALKPCKVLPKYILAVKFCFVLFPLVQVREIQKQSSLPYDSTLPNRKDIRL